MIWNSSFVLWATGSPVCCNEEPGQVLCLRRSFRRHNRYWFGGLPKGKDRNWCYFLNAYYALLCANIMLGSLSSVIFVHSVFTAGKREPGWELGSESVDCFGDQWPVLGLTPKNNGEWLGVLQAASVLFSCSWLHPGTGLVSCRAEGRCLAVNQVWQLPESQSWREAII